MKALKRNCVLAVALSAMLCVTGCTDAEKGRIASFGSGGTIVCYSGGKEIYRGESTGKINANKQHTGFDFVDKSTNKFVRVNGDCVVNN